MAKRILVLLLVFGAFQVKAADLLVEEFGLSPAYSSIQTAVTAAADGDRIIIRNRVGNIPWVENITINKSLEFLSYDNDTFFVVQGNYTIAPSTGRVVSIIGMRNTSGSISSSTSGSGRTTVNIFDSYIQSGIILFNDNGFDLNVVGSELDDGSITFRYGNIIGNDIADNNTTGLINVQTDGTASNDFIKIYGNKLNNTSTSTSTQVSCIYSISSSHFLDIRNNLCVTRAKGIYIDNTKNSSAEILRIYNNSIAILSGTTSSSLDAYGIYLEAVGSSAIVEVMNNLIDIQATSSTPDHQGIYSVTASGQRNVYYNVVDNSSTFNGQITGSWTVNTNNTTTVAVSLNTITAASTASVDNGNPANQFFDINLTRNDAGALGGSFTLDNFFPLHSGSARVYLVDFPFNIRQGNTLSIQAESFDR